MLEPVNYNSGIFFEGFRRFGEGKGVTTCSDTEPPKTGRNLANSRAFFPCLPQDIHYQVIEVVS